MTSLHPRLAQLEKAWNKRFAGLAGKLPAYGVITHVGRKSGKTYRTPVNVFPRGGRMAVTLPYGDKTDWVLNLLAAGEGEVTHRGRTYKLTNIRVMNGEPVADLALPARLAAPFVKVLVADLTD